jgi:hypothetical protein
MRENRVLKVKRATPDLDIFEIRPFYPNCVSGRSSRCNFDVVTDYGANVAIIMKVQKCIFRQNQTKSDKFRQVFVTMMFDFGIIMATFRPIDGANVAIQLG